MTLLYLSALLLLTTIASTAPVNLRLTVRQETCSDKDTACWNSNGVIFTNAFRAEKGKGPLVSGPPSMLKNAVDHSKTMDAAGSIFHQDLSAASRAVGCGLFVGFENVASFGARGSFDGNPASRQLLDQWINSKPHRETLLTVEEGSYVVVGVYVGGSSTYGTQVFASGTSTCGETAAADTPVADVTEEPAAMATTKAPKSARATKASARATAATVPAANAEMPDGGDKGGETADAEESDSTTSPAPTSTKMETAADAMMAKSADEGKTSAGADGPKIMQSAGPANKVTAKTASESNNSDGKRTLFFRSWDDFMTWFSSMTS